MQQADILFEAKGLTIGYKSPVGSLHLFDNLDLQLRAGELVCFMGPNGSGKSTLIRTLAGLQSPMAGRVPVKDEKRVAVVLTDRIQSQHMKVLDLVAFGRYPYLDWNLVLSDEDRAKISESIAVVKIGHLLDRTLNELSDGQMQMVMIARALAQDTPVLLLDEPTAHLDLNNRLEIMNLLRKLAREQLKAILLATHELDLALQTADVVWLVDNKKIKAGTPEDLVLDGSFDGVFQFKGYDLKTGKVEHEAFRKVSVRINGEGPIYLWTKNAVERNGFVVSDVAPITIEINEDGWSVDGMRFSKLSEVVEVIGKSVIGNR
jgi:iron complex transport system ATP-binding protein